MPAFRPLAGGPHHLTHPAPQHQQHQQHPQQSPRPTSSPRNRPASAHVHGGGGAGGAAAAAAAAARSGSATRGAAAAAAARAAAAAAASKRVTSAAARGLLDRSLPATRTAAALEDELTAARGQLAAARDEQRLAVAALRRNEAELQVGGGSMRINPLAGRAWVGWGYAAVMQVRLR